MTPDIGGVSFNAVEYLRTVKQKKVILVVKRDPPWYHPMEEPTPFAAEYLNSVITWRQCVPPAGSYYGAAVPAW